MKVFLYILLGLSFLSIIFNALALDFENVTSGDSLVALISIVAALCAMILVLIFIRIHQIKSKIDHS